VRSIKRSENRYHARLAAAAPARGDPRLRCPAGCTRGNGGIAARRELAALAACEAPLAGTPFGQLRDALQAQLQQALAQLDPPPLSQPLAFNALGQARSRLTQRRAMPF